MVACLFARSAYNDEQLGECLDAAGYENLAAAYAQETAEYIRKLRWKVRIDSGFKPQGNHYPTAFLQS